MKLVYIARTDIPALGVKAGQHVVTEPGAPEGVPDVVVINPLPRGRLGHVLGASLDGALDLVATDPPVLSDTPETILRRATIQVVGGPPLSRLPEPWPGD